jgi:hypothetical protein
MWVSIHKVQ